MFDQKETVGDGGWKWDKREQRNKRETTTQSENTTIIPESERSV